MSTEDSLSQTTQRPVRSTSTEANTEAFLENESEYAAATNNLNRDNLLVEDADEQITQPKQPPPKKLQKRTKPMEDPRIQEAYKVLQDVHTRYISSKQQPLEVPDRFAIYGQHVANKLRQYTPRAEILVEHHINNILFQADLGNYDGNEHNFYSYQQYPNISTPLPSPSPNMSSTSIHSTTAPDLNCPNVIEVYSVAQLDASGSNNRPELSTTSCQNIVQLEPSAP